jgi:hypothetical protein
MAPPTVAVSYALDPVISLAEFVQAEDEPASTTVDARDGVFAASVNVSHALGAAAV